MLKKNIIAALCLLCCTILGAVPAYKGTIVLSQPDGMTFHAVMSGDEFRHSVTTLDGCAVMRAADGVWYYAYHDMEGRKTSTGFAVGDVSVPRQVLNNSRLGALTKSASSLDHASARVLRAQQSKNGALQYNRVPVILAQFADTKYTYSPDQMAALFDPSNPKSATSYFNDQFLGQSEFVFDVTSAVVTVSHNSAYYASNNMAKVCEFIAEACRLASEAGLVDFSNYDLDSDGLVDRLYVFYAGDDQAYTSDDSMIWAHQYYIQEDNVYLTLNGKVINCYACSSEKSFVGNRITGIGTFCHEFTHTLGIDDLYDTDDTGSGGTSEALWDSGSLMDGGCYNDNGDTPPSYGAIERYILGINPGRSLESGSTTLRSVAEAGDYIICPSPTVEGEYYLIECRTASGWDTHIGASGVAIYHLDRSNNNTGHDDTYGNIFTQGMTAAERWTYNVVNCNPSHQCADLVEAYPNAGTIGQTYFPYNSINSFTPDTRPAFRWWDGTASPYYLTGITFDGTQARFTVVDANTIIPAPVITGTSNYQNLCIIQWSAPEGSGPATVRWGKSGSELNEIIVNPYDTGLYALRLEGLIPGTAYRVDIFFTDSEGGEGKVVKADFTTKARHSGTYPYICLGNASRYADNSFPSGTSIPLCIMNTDNTSTVRWYLGTNEISPSPDGFYHLVSSGILKAVTSRPDGSKDIIIKTITVK